jgi:YjbE family integral membrane protein
VDGSLIGATLEVLLVNIVLSGDNAVVIGMAAHGLPTRQRRQAILLGGLLAVLLRLVLTIPAERVLQVPFLGAAGGLLLAWVAYRLLTGEDIRDDRDVASVWAAVRLMVLADATMSLDNVLAVAAIAESTAHPAPVLILGLALSIPIVLLGGGLIATLLERFSWLAWLGAAVLTITAASLITNDKGLRGHLGSSRSSDVAVAAGLSALVLGAAWRETRRVGENLAAAEANPADDCDHRNEETPPEAAESALDD